MQSLTERGIPINNIDILLYVDVPRNLTVLSRVGCFAAYMYIKSKD